VQRSDIEKYSGQSMLQASKKAGVTYGKFRRSVIKHGLEDLFPVDRKLSTLERPFPLKDITFDDIKACEGMSISLCARKLGVSRQILIRRLDEYDELSKLFHRQKKGE